MYLLQDHKPVKTHITFRVLREMNRIARARQSLPIPPQ